MQGFLNTRPVITSINTDDPSTIGFSLADGRIIYVPVSAFPSIAALSLDERRNWTVMDDQLFTFAACDEVFHIEQVLGKEQLYSYHFTAA
jgi:hypothetical protein